MAANAEADVAGAILASGPILHHARAAGSSRRLTYVSPNAQRLTGRAHDALLAAPDGWADLIHPDDRERYDAAETALSRVPELEVVYRLRLVQGERWVRDSLRRCGDMLVGSAIDIGRERAAQSDHRDAEVLMETMVRSALDAVIAIDRDGMVLEFNPAAEEMFGYARREVVGRLFSEIVIPPELRVRHEASMARFRATGETDMPDRRIQVEVMRKDGSRFPAEVTIARATLADRPIFVGEIRDISERVDALAERDRITAQLREAIESLPVGFSITDHDDRIMLCNEVFARAYGRPAAAMRGKARLDLVFESIPNLRKIDGIAFHGTPSEVDALHSRLREPDGQPMEVELATGATIMVWSSRLPAGGVVCVRTDVTQLRRAEQMMRESTEVIRRVLESCPMPIGMTRAVDGLVIYESAASKALFGRDPDVAPVSTRTAFVDPADRDRYVEALRATGRIEGFEVQMRRFDGTPFWAALSARLIEFHGEPVIVSSTFDLTERRAVQAELDRQREALHQNEKLAALGELLAGVAHELNNPLSVIIGQALLLEDASPDPAIAARIAKIGRAADRCVRIVRSFLSMARQQPRRTQRVDLGSLVRQTVEVTEHGLTSSGIEVQLRLAAGLPSVEGDPDQLVQVLTNLIFNAEGALREIAGPRHLEIGTRSVADRVEIYLRDNGPGIPVELQPRVFEPFFTTKEAGAGTGIGLAYCHRVVEAHGGTIRLESTPGRGAAFTISLPVDRRPSVEESEEPAAPTASGHRVLVIDDEVDVADIVAAMLRAEGHEVDIAHSGREALRRIGEVAYRAILSDLRMPGLDGEKLYEHILAESPAAAARIGFMTGDAMGRRAQTFLRRCGRPVIEKPIRPAEARRLIADLVEGVAADAPKARARLA